MKQIVVLIIFLCNVNLFAESWVVTYCGQPKTLKGVWFVNNTTGFIVGEDVIVKTTNTGVNWATTQVRFNLHAVTFIDNQTGFAVGRSNDSAFILKTTNAGGSWENYLLGINNSDDFSRIFFINANTGYAVRNFGRYYKTTNSGQLWILKTLGNLDYINDFIYYRNSFYKIGSRQDNNNFWRPAVWSSSDENNWSSPDLCMTCGTNTYGIKLNFFDTTSYLVRGSTSGPGAGDRIYKTSPQGWASIGSGQPLSIGFSNNGKFVCYGYYDNAYSYLMSSSNSGELFKRDSLSDFSVKSIYFIDQSIGFAVGINGLIAKTSNGGGTIGITQISNNVPEQFSLKQNYPNPFNPSTQIEFTVSEKEFVKITVFDITGRVIEKLVNEELKIGTYKVNFNADSYSSGMYFYRLETDGYSETKKMVLIK